MFFGMFMSHLLEMYSIFPSIFLYNTIKFIFLPFFFLTWIVFVQYFLFLRFLQYNFEGRYDLVRFIETIKRAGLYAHLRIGPYVCAEWNFGLDLNLCLTLFLFFSFLFFSLKFIYLFFFISFLISLVCCLS